MEMKELHYYLPKNRKTNVVFLQETKFSATLIWNLRNHWHRRERGSLEMMYTSGLEQSGCGTYRYALDSVTSFSSPIEQCHHIFSTINISSIQLE